MARRNERLWWLCVLPLVLAAAALIVGIVASPGERDGTFVMFGGRGGYISPQENVSVLEKLQAEGYNVPPQAISEARQNATVSRHREAISVLAYLIAAALGVGAVVGFFAGGGVAAVKGLRKGKPGPAEGA